MLSAPPQPNSTAHIKMNGRSFVYHHKSDLVWNSSESRCGFSQEVRVPVDKPFQNKAPQLQRERVTVEKTFSAFQHHKTCGI